MSDGHSTTTAPGGLLVTKGKTTRLRKLFTQQLRDVRKTNADHPQCRPCNCNACGN